MISGGMLVLWIMMMILMRKQLKDPWELLKRKKNYFKTMIIPVLLHGYISIWSSIWRVINAIGIGGERVSSIGICRIVVATVCDLIFNPVGAHLWLGCIGGTPSPLRRKLIRKREEKWRMILEHFHRFTYRRIRRGRQFFSCESSPELIFSQNLYVQYCHASRWQWLWWL